MLPVFGMFFFPDMLHDAREVPECHLDLIRELTSPANRGIIFPRGFAKSTWEKIDTIHDIVYALEPVILYIGESLTKAGYHFESIKSHLENNDALRYVYGDLVPPKSLLGRKWTNKHFETTNRVNCVATGRGKGRGVNIKDGRPTKIIVDDAEDDKMVRSPDLRAEYHDWLYNVILLSLDNERGKAKVIGTVIHEKCEVLAFYKAYGGIFRRGIEDGKSIWEAYWPLAKLLRLRDGWTEPDGQVVKGWGTRVFNREIMNDVHSDEEAKIKRAWIDENSFDELWPDFSYECYVYIDPQAGSKKTADEAVITTLYSAVRSEHRFCYRQKAMRASQFEQAKEVVRTWIRHKRVCRAVGVEVVLNQTAVWQTIQDWKNRKLDFNTKEMTKEDTEWIDESDRNIPLRRCSPNGKDKVARLEVFEPDFERGFIHLRPDQEELANQLMFTMASDKEHNDRGDSLVGALEMVGNRSGASAGAEARDVDPAEARNPMLGGTIGGDLKNKVF